MTPTLHNLIREAVELTGADPPELVRDDAPVLADAPQDGHGRYLVGLIGGKDVGKSALVNALVGHEITPRTSYGPGTEIAIAYAHESQQADLSRLLEEQIPGRYRIVTHAIDDLSRQVLLDLPDIDSRFSDHVQLTRRVLRHMLFPIWIQSVEKYADQQPQKLLSQVAAGNDPANFIFCLNKADQIGEDKTSLDALREDFGQRLARTLAMPAPPDVHVISAVQPEKFDLPALRRLLSRQKSEQTVRHSLDIAGRRRKRSVVAWIDSLDLPGQIERLDRLIDEAEETLSERIGVPLLEQVIPHLIDDPANRMALVDTVLGSRVTRWPIVNLVHTLLSPLSALVRRNIGAAAVAPLRQVEAMVDAQLRAADPSMSMLLQATFAQLQQSHPLLGPLYEQRKLWESMPADRAVGELRRELGAAMQRQREAAVTRLSGGGRILAPPRWLLTIGAVIWFPFGQPLLEAYLRDDGFNLTKLPLLLVQLLSVTALLKSVAFLAAYFLVIWVVLRWDTQRRVNRLLRRWKLREGLESSLNLAGTAWRWMQELLEPLRRRRERVATVIDQAEKLREDSAGKPAG